MISSEFNRKRECGTGLLREKEGSLKKTKQNKTRAAFDAEGKLVAN